MHIYGKHAVIEALREGQVTRVLLAQGVQPATARQLERLARQRGVPLEQLPRIVLDQLLKTTHHQGVAAELPELRLAEPEAPLALAKARGERLLVVLCDQLSDPRNYGAIIRSAEVLGAHGVVSEERRSAPLSPVAVKASAGAASHLPVVQVKNLPRYIDELKAQGVWVYGASSAGASPPEAIDWDRDVALVIGSEGTGMRRLVREKCDGLITIPMKGRIGSLNAAVAAGILIYSIVHSREYHGQNA